MEHFEKLSEHIYRLKVPFENIYTAVFLIRHSGGYMLVDCATDKHDAENIILPAIYAMGIENRDITHILITHPHGDHAGGLRHILPYLSDAVVCAGSEYIRERLAPAHFMCLSDGDTIAEDVVAVSLPGHCSDMLGYLDTRDMTLISGDAVQLCGVGRYGCGLGSFSDYFATLDKLSDLHIETLIASHDYYPNGSIARTRDEIAEYIENSRRYAEYIVRVSDGFAQDSVPDEKVITDAIREKNTANDEKIPPLQYSTVKAYLTQKY